MKWNFSKIMALGNLSIISLNVMAAGNITGYRGQVFYFTEDPVFSQNAYKYYKDGILYIHMIESASQIVGSKSGERNHEH